ncbi:hypothetical protein [Sansalvadorimonas verongulae]|uniref:hypothetical protein n=1 Tax=Sansalvadorimonas verongulae TaxID=2172824 RepID=UPI0012BB884C|nr:hypothetical protein [Sansalvadorimonas verongulae]MTI12051.1 hypothetical protein [Sansalvadorimonas verongulae]
MSAGYGVVKAGGTQGDQDIENHVYWGYKVYTDLNRFACEEAPASNGGLSHSVVVCSYSE